MACKPIRGYTPSFSWARVKMEFLFYLSPILHSLLHCRIRHRLLNAGLPKTVKPGAAMRVVRTLLRAVSNCNCYSQLFLFHSYIEFLILNEFVRRFFQILQMSFQKKIQEIYKNVCEQWDITETNNWIRLLIFDDNSLIFYFFNLSLNNWLVYCRIFTTFFVVVFE